MSKDQNSPIRPFNLRTVLDSEAHSSIQPTNLAHSFGSATLQNTHPNGGSLTIGNQNNAPFIPFPQMPSLPSTPTSLISTPTGSVLGIHNHGPSMSIAQGTPLQAVAAPFTIGSLDYSPSSSFNTPSTPFARLSVGTNLNDDFRLSEEAYLSDTGSTSGDDLSDEDIATLFVGFGSATPTHKKRKIDQDSSDEPESKAIKLDDTPQSSTKRARDSEISEEPDAKVQKVDSTPENAAGTIQLGHFTHLISPITSSEDLDENVFEDLEFLTSDDDTVITPTALNTAFIGSSEDDTSDYDTSEDNISLDGFKLFTPEELAELSGNNSLEGLNP